MRTLTGQHYIVNCTGRKPEKGDVHVYVYVNHGAAHQKQTNKPCNIVSHLYTDTKYKDKIQFLPSCQLDSCMKKIDM